MAARAAEIAPRFYNSPPKTANQVAIQKLNARDSDLWSTGEVKQRAAMNELRRHLAAEATDDEKQDIADAPVEKLREQYGVDHTKVPKPFRAQWGEHEEATLLATFAQQGVAPEAVTAIMDWYTGVFNGALGNTANVNVAQVENEFRVLAKKHGIADSVADALVRHHTDRLGSQDGPTGGDNQRPPSSSG